MTTPATTYSSLIDPTFLFRFEVPIRAHDCTFATAAGGLGLELPESCRLASFGELGGKRIFAEVRIAWDYTAIALGVEHDGYRLAGRIAASAMTGFDAIQYPRLGLYYAVIDRELGWQTFSLSEEYPVVEDPSLWGEAVLEK